MARKKTRGRAQRARQPTKPKQQPRPARPARRRRGRKGGSARGAMVMSKAGINFLKCAFAPPDFNVDPGEGIPDRFDGKVLPMKHVLNSTVTFTAGNDTYLLVLPTPGVAYWTCSVAAGTSLSGQTFTNVNYPGVFGNLFGNTSGNTDNYVSAYRYASTCIELISTSNMQQYAGSISTWKFKVGLSTNHINVTAPTIPPLVFTTLNRTITGLDSVLNIGADNFARSFTDGVCVTAACDQSDFPFYPMLCGENSLGGTVAGNVVNMPIELSCPVLGWIAGCDGMDAIMIKVSVPTGATDAAIVKNWACVEYRPTSFSWYEQFAKKSPEYDPVALEMYRKIASSMPVAVTSAENGKLWETVKKFIGTALSAASYVPGPIGEGANHLIGLSNLLGRMTM